MQNGDALVPSQTTTISPDWHDFSGFVWPLAMRRAIWVNHSKPILFAMTFLPKATHPNFKTLWVIVGLTLDPNFRHPSVFLCWPCHTPGIVVQLLQSRLLIVHEVQQPVASQKLGWAAEVSWIHQTRPVFFEGCGVWYKRDVVATDMDGPWMAVEFLYCLINQRFVTYIALNRSFAQRGYHPVLGHLSTLLYPASLGHFLLRLAQLFNPVPRRKPTGPARNRSGPWWEVAVGSPFHPVLGPNLFRKYIMFWWWLHMMVSICSNPVWSQAPFDAASCKSLMVFDGLLLA